jgi:pimeloyl-ACP methyl ester carboxylesterase
VTAHARPRGIVFTGAAGNRLVGDVFGPEPDDKPGAAGRPVLLLHGGGQTRYAWRSTADRVAQAGMTAYAVDQRGHGDSEWIADGAYGFDDFAADAAGLSRALAERTLQLPVVVGASLGGIAALLAAGQGASFAALVLVDITPRVDMDGVARVQGFMRAHAGDGFGSIDEAAAAVAAYLPHRKPPRSNEGLKKNLRLHPDGRWRWHWDPRFLDGRRSVSTERREAELVAAARRLTMPTLLVRGASSELVHEAHAREFLDLVPHAHFVDVSGARHMVAGDRNDQFAAAILGFVGALDS